MTQSNFNLYVIADALDHFRLMEDPYEYHDCEGMAKPPSEPSLH